ncbi:MAG: PhzF family phenazine biosynthesis protein [Steroidobacteraceae bacterium]
MSRHPFRILNVFTHDRGGPLSGNPLCVFENGAGFGTRMMQALARQFNLSETTFILPSSSADARVRIFTPTYEMPFAGHPTLGTAHVCRALGLGGDSLRLEMQAGLIPVVAQGDRWTLAAPTPTWREVEESRSDLARALGLDAQDIGERPLWVKAGKEQLVVPLASVEAVRRVSPDAQALRQIRSEDGIGMAYVFAFTGPDSALARFFFPQGAAILEDPATGSATANFGGWCLGLRRPLPVNLSIAQGEFVGRPSSLFLQVAGDGGIFVGGDVLEIGRGSVDLDVDPG